MSFDFQSFIQSSQDAIGNMSSAGNGQTTGTGGSDLSASNLAVTGIESGAIGAAISVATALAANFMQCGTASKRGCTKRDETKIDLRLNDYADSIVQAMDSGAIDARTAFALMVKAWGEAQVGYKQIDPTDDRWFTGHSYETATECGTRAGLRAPICGQGVGHSPFYRLFVALRSGQPGPYGYVRAGLGGPLGYDASSYASGPGWAAQQAQAEQQTQLAIKKPSGFGGLSGKTIGIIAASAFVAFKFLKVGSLL